MYPVEFSKGSARLFDDVLWFMGSIAGDMRAEPKLRVVVRGHADDLFESDLALVPRAWSAAEPTHAGRIADLLAARQIAIDDRPVAAHRRDLGDPR